MQKHEDEVREKQVWVDEIKKLLQQHAEEEKREKRYISVYRSLVCFHYSSSDSSFESNGTAYTGAFIRRQQRQVLFSEEKRIFKEKRLTKK